MAATAEWTWSVRGQCVQHVSADVTCHQTEPSQRRRAPVPLTSEPIPALHLPVSTSWRGLQTHTTEILSHLSKTSNKTDVKVIIMLLSLCNTFVTLFDENRGMR